jgi:hypothetical protein
VLELLDNGFVRVEHWPAPDNPQEYEMPESRFRLAERMAWPR